MFNQNIISNKFDLNLSTTLSSYYIKMLVQAGMVCKRKTLAYFDIVQGEKNVL